MSKKQLFNMGDLVSYQKEKFVIIKIDNEKSTEPIITLAGGDEKFEVKESELLMEDYQ